MHYLLSEEGDTLPTVVVLVDEDRSYPPARYVLADYVDREAIELRAKLAYLEAYGIKIVDAVAGGYEIYDENLRTIDKLRELVRDMPTLGPTITGETSDGYHTFNELYHHRAVLFSVIVRDHPDIAWKSKTHHDGTMYDGMFIVGVDTPEGQATYHYDIDPYWDMFDCKELDSAPEWDGHTPDQAIARIATLGRGECRLITGGILADKDCWHTCDACGVMIYNKPEWTQTRYCPYCGRRVVE